ncbi:EamA family transporter [Paenibacillus sp. MER 180]|uniref:EamA family transporter n=1 Tax=Paenibacillus sp. MER 180 TaxID=2939570 RepID=UPI0037CB78A7
MSVILIVSLILVNSFAQILLKKGALKINGRSIVSFLNVETILGYSLFFLSTIMSVLLLNYVNFKTLTIVIALNFVCTLILSALMLRERLTRQKALSTMIIVVGVIVFNL